MRRLALTLLLLPAAAAAQDRPPAMQPTRDVAVTYRVDAGPQGQQTMRMAWLTAEQKLRVDPPGGMGWMVMDRRAGNAFMVMEAQRMVMQLPMQGAAGMVMRTEPPADARFSHAGIETVAGLRCTLWRFEQAQARGTACVTDDGVMLRTESEAQGHRGRVEATEVAYGAQDPARFRAPAGFQSMQMPGGMPGMGAPAMPGAPSK